MKIWADVRGEMLKSLKVVLILCRARVQVQILAQQVRRHLSLALHLHKAPLLKHKTTQITYQVIRRL